MVSDLLIPVGDALITEQVAQTFGDLSLLLLLGSMDADCAAGEEAAWLSRYEMLQYNALFDGKGRNPILFGQG